MVLGIISDCIHVKNGGFPIGSKVHVFVRQMDHLSTYFEHVYVCAPVVNINENQSAISVYENRNIEFVPIPLAGGNSITSKIKIAFVLPIWIYKIIIVCSKSDVVYLRAPNNISIPGFVISRLFKKRRFATFTGTWCGYKTEPITYKLQRKYLSKVFEGSVFVYGRLPFDRKNIYDTISPSYSVNDWHQESVQVENRLKELAAQQLIERRIYLITVGSLTDNKNQIFILKALTQLKLLNIKFVLWVAGDGQNLQKYQDFVEQNGLKENVFFLGHIDQSQLREYYRKADFVVQAPLQEGFGKVPIEGFFHGVVPVLSDVNLSRSIVGGKERGRVFSDQNELIEHIYSLCYDSDSMAKTIKNGREYARKNTLEFWSQEMVDRIKSQESGK